MAGLKKSHTLFDAVPALSAISAHGQGVAKLIPVGFDHPGFELLEGMNKIGRDPNQNHHVIYSHHVSRNHCEILLGVGQIWVRDLDSQNGVFVNGERVKQTELQPGDKLGISRRITFVLVQDPVLEKPIDMDLELHEARGPGEQSQAMPLQEPVHASPSVNGQRAFAPSLTGPQVQARPPPPSYAPSGSQVVQAPARATASYPPPRAPAEAAPPPLPESRSERIPFQSASPPVDDSIVAEEETDLAVQLQELEHQRNILAILYQISLHCLMADNQKEVEKLLVNVLQRLVPMDAGFIIYQTQGSWRASICPNSRPRPADHTIRAFYHLAAQHREPLVLEEQEDLQRLGVQGQSAIVVPLAIDGTVNGVIGAISNQLGVFTNVMLDIMIQLSNVSAAALRDR